MIRRLVALALLPALAACAVGPDYRAPDLTPAPAFRNADPAWNAARPGPEWWRGFNDPILDGLEAKALAQNLDLAQAVSRVSQSRAGLQPVAGALLPAAQANVQPAYNRQSLLGSSGPFSHLPGYHRDGSLYDVTAGASWELDLFGGLRRQFEAARADYQAAKASASASRMMVCADVADAYLQLRGDQRRLALALEQTRIDGDYVDLVRLRFQVGQAARRDVDAAEAALGQAQASVPSLRIAVEVQLNRLAVLIGEAPEAERGALEVPAPVPSPPPLGAGRPADLLRARPDLAVAERRLAAANARIGAAISDYYPKITLQGLLGYESTASRGLFSAAAGESQASVGIKWRLFDFSRVAAEVALARGRDAEALAAYRQAVLRAAEDVENALAARLQREDQTRRLHEARDALVRSRQAAQDAYGAGQISLLEVIDADRQLLQTQDAAAQADTDLARASVALVRALGG